MASDPAGPIFGRDSPDAAWRPTPELLQDSRLARFLRATGEPSLDALQARAVADPGWFWGAAADDIGIAWQRRPSEVLDASRRPGLGALVGRRRVRLRAGGDRAAGHARPGWRSARLGGRGWRRPPADQRASSRPRSRRPCAASAGTGSAPGDRVGILLPMLAETVIAVLALGRIGAIYTPIFSGYAAPAVAARLADCEATLLITADGFLRRGSWVPLKAVADEAAALAPSVRPDRSSSAARAMPSPRRGTPDRDAWWHDEPATPDAAPPPADAADRPRDAVHAHLHLGHDRPAEGRGPRPRRLPDQGRAGPRPHVRPARRATRCSGSPTSAG